MKCSLCGSHSLEIVYDGPIRSSGASAWRHAAGFTVRQCAQCGLSHLWPRPENLAGFYSSTEYYQTRFGSIDIEAQRAKLWPEQVRWLSEIGLGVFLGRIVADFGCGPGIFLDLIQGHTATTIGVESALHFASILDAGAHRHVADAAALEEATVDVAVSFDTLEHVPDPTSFLSQMHKCLKPGGRAFVGVPNDRDFLKDICKAYLPFFYHTSHLHYFTKETLTALLEHVGFAVDSVRFVHKYNMMNMVKWLSEGKPTGNDHSRQIFDRHFEDAFRSHVERQGAASHLLVAAYKQN